MLVFITGVAGSGKSALAAELQARGEEAYDADDGVSGHYSRAGGEPAPTPPRENQTADWAADHGYRFDLEQVRSLACGETTRPVYLLGAAYGDDEVVAIADRSFYLDIDEPELRRRLHARGESGYGSAPHELAAILEWHSGAAARYEALGASRLDARQPVTALANALLTALEPELRASTSNVF